MAVSKQKKAEIVKQLSDKISRQQAIIFADFTGVKVKDLSSLKMKLKQANAEFKVAKKTLMQVAFKGQKIDFDAKSLEGEIGLALGYGDPVSPAKIVYEFSKTNDKIKILGGYLQGRALAIPEVMSLALLPSREQLLANLVGSLSSPMRGFASVLQGNIRGLVLALSQIQKTKA